jgi:cytochrome oxidase Cu insertion factor (SCO1/SenC/PrrC family)
MNSMFDILMNTLMCCIEQDDEDDYLVDHSIVMYLVGPDGMFEDFYTQLTEADEAAARIKKVVMDHRENAEAA